MLAFQLLESDRCGDRQSAERKESDHENIHHRRKPTTSPCLRPRKRAKQPADWLFGSQKELAKLSAEWPVSRFIEIWNGFAGVAPFGELKPVKKFTDRKVAVSRIWQAIQRLNADGAASSVPGPEVQPAQEGAAPEAVPESVPESAAEVPVNAATEVAPTPEAPSQAAVVPEVAEAAETAAVTPQVPDVAPEVSAATTDASPAANAPAAERPATKQPKRKKAAKASIGTRCPAREQDGPGGRDAAPPGGRHHNRDHAEEGLVEAHGPRVMAGTMKKAGYNVESFKPEGGERSYASFPSSIARFPSWPARQMPRRAFSLVEIICLLFRCKRA